MQHANTAKIAELNQLNSHEAKCDKADTHKGNRARKKGQHLGLVSLGVTQTYLALGRQVNTDMISKYYTQQREK